VPCAQHPACARAEQPLGIGDRLLVPAQLDLEQLDPAERLTQPGLVPDEVVAEHKKLLAQPQVLLGDAIAARLDLRVGLVALVWRTVLVDALTATEGGVLHAGRD
jgi:hypothetical protein